MLNRPLRAAFPSTLVGWALAAVSLPAGAALGGAPMATPSGATSVTSAPTAHVASAATAAASSNASASTAYAVRETQLATGTTIREYIGADGKVFGIAWSGPRMPDLQALLGSYFPQYASGVQAVHAVRHSRGPIAIEQPDLVVHSGGHMGSFFGQAWLPSALPSGLTGADIK